MSGLSIVGVVAMAWIGAVLAFCAGMMAWAAWARLLDRVARGDRRRRIAECSAYGGKLVYDAPSGAEEMERMRAGAAWVEAWALQLDAIRALPEVARP